VRRLLIDGATPIRALVTSPFTTTLFITALWLGPASTIAFAQPVIVEENSPSAGHARTTTIDPSAAAEEVDEIDPSLSVSDTVIEVAGWAISSGDHRDLPFAIVDKRAAQILVFDETGKLRGMAPVLLGSATGDHSAPGVGDRELADIPMDDRTTPAGRFYASYGPAIGVPEALWIDYATAVSIHPILPTAEGKRRKKWLASPSADDNRVTHGCVNVSPEFYQRIVRPILGRRSIFYVLPEVGELQEALPGFAPPRRVAGRRR
jgi:hypothetical protein